MPCTCYRNLPRTNEMYSKIFISTCNITSINYGRSRQLSHRTDISLDTKDIGDSFVVQTIRYIEKTGQALYGAPVEERLIKPKKKTFDPNKEHVVSLC